MSEGEGLFFEGLWGSVYRGINHPMRTYGLYTYWCNLSLSGTNDMTELIDNGSVTPGPTLPYKTSEVTLVKVSASEIHMIGGTYQRVPVATHYR